MYLGIDLGTSGVKSLVIDDEHQVVAIAEASLEVQRPADGWSCLLYTSPSPRDGLLSRMPSSA